MASDPRNDEGEPETAGEPTCCGFEPAIWGSVARGGFELRFFLVWCREVGIELFGLVWCREVRIEEVFLFGLVQGDGIIGFGFRWTCDGARGWAGRVLGDEHTRQRGRTGKSQKNRSLKNGGMQRKRETR